MKNFITNFKIKNANKFDEVETVCNYMLKILKAIKLNKIFSNPYKT